MPQCSTTHCLLWTILCVALVAHGFTNLAFPELIVKEKFFGKGADKFLADPAFMHFLRAFGIGCLTAVCVINGKYTAGMIVWFIAALLLTMSDSATHTPPGSFFGVAAIMLTNGILASAPEEYASYRNSVRKATHGLFLLMGVGTLYNPLNLLGNFPGYQAKLGDKPVPAHHAFVARNLNAAMFLWVIPGFLQVCCDKADKNSGIAVVVAGAILLANKYSAGLLEANLPTLGAAGFVFIGLALLFIENGTKMVACDGTCCSFSACCFGGGDKKSGSRSQSSSQPAPVKSKKGKSKSKK